MIENLRRLVAAVSAALPASHIFVSTILSMPPTATWDCPNSYPLDRQQVRGSSADTAGPEHDP